MNLYKKNHHLSAAAAGQSQVLTRAAGPVVAAASRPHVLTAVATAAALALAFAMAFTGCSTTVKQDVERPANLEVENYATVSALPFKTLAQMGKDDDYDDTPVETFEDYYQKLGQKAASESDEQALLALLDERLMDRLTQSKQLKFVDPDSVQYAIRQRKEIPADVYITGGFTKFSSTIEKEDVDTGKKDDDDKPIMETRYWREASARVLYQVVETGTNRVISKNEFSFSDKSDKNTNWKKVSSTYTVLSPYLNSVVSNIMKDFTPHTETRELTLLKGKGKDMKEADKLAGKGSLVPARNRFLSIYRETGLFEAGYNAALLYEAVDEYDSALKLMNDVWKNSGDSRAKEKLKELEQEAEAARRLQAQKNKR